MPDELRNSLLLKNEMSNNIEHDSSNLPLEVDNYHSLSLLEASSNLPVPSTTTYKATHSSTGIKYCLRRLHGKIRPIIIIWHAFNPLITHQALEFNRWNWWCKSSTSGRNFRIRIVWRFAKSSQQKHSETTRSYWCTTCMPDLRRYYRNISHQWPTAMEWRVRHFRVMRGLSVTKAHCNGLVRIDEMLTNWRFGWVICSLFHSANGPILQENEIWNVIIQLTCGLRAIHQANLACRWEIHQHITQS